MSSAKPAPELAVVIVNFACSHLLPRLINSLDYPCRLVVVDNFSSAEELERLREVLPANSELVSRPNDGFAGGVNAGLARVPADHWALLANPDSYFLTGSLKKLNDDARKHSIDIASPAILREDGRVWFAGGAIRGWTNEVVHYNFGRPLGSNKSWQESEFISGCLMLLSPEARRLLLPLREDLFMYYEDVDLSIRASASGLRLGIVFESIARHDEGASSKGRGGIRSPLYYFYQSRNRLLVSRARSRWPKILLTPIVLCRQIARILLREDDVRRKVTAALAGTTTGLRMAARTSKAAIE